MGSSNSRESTTIKVANGTSENELLLSTKPPKTPRSSTAKNPDPESSGAESCDHMDKVVMSKLNSIPTCLLHKLQRKSESCSTRQIHEKLLLLRLNCSKFKIYL